MADIYLPLNKRTGELLTFVCAEKLFHDSDKKFKRPLQARRKFSYSNDYRTKKSPYSLKWLSSAEANVTCMEQYNIKGFVVFRPFQLASSFRVCTVRKDNDNRKIEYFSFATRSEMSFEILKHLYETFAIRLSVGVNHFRVILCIQTADAPCYYYVAFIGPLNIESFILFSKYLLTLFEDYAISMFGSCPEVQTLSVIIRCASEEEEDDEFAYY